MSEARDTGIDLETELRSMRSHLERTLEISPGFLASLPPPDESDERYSFILEQIRAVIIDVGADGRITYASRTARDIYGFSSEEMVGRPWLDGLHPDDLEQGVEFVRAIRMQRSPARAVYRMRHREGHWFWLEATLVMAYRERDGGIHIATFTRDVTEAKGAADALTESEERYRAVAATSCDLIAEFDRDGLLVNLSETVQQLLGFEPEELLGTDFLQVVHPDDVRRVDGLLRKGMETGIPQPTGRYRARHKDGSWLWLEGTGVSYPQADGRVIYLAVTSDITDRVRAEVESRDLADRMQQAQKLESLGVMAGGIAHDFNNLLTPILGEAGLSLLDLPPESPARTQIQKIQKAAHRAAALTNQMLAYAGEGPLLMEPTQLSNLVEEMARLLETGAPASTRFIYELDEAVPPVEADESQLSQVVMNLITNATEAVGGDRGGEVTIRCGAVRPSREDLVRAFLGEALTPGLFSYIEVCDNGSGIDAETRGRIFDPFFTTKFTGRGLGLAAVLGIVRSHRGGIEIESEPGVGTRFRVIFPAARDLELPAGGETESRPIENWQTHGVALVVDDDQAVREFAEDTLLRAGFSVLSAADGREGIETFRKHAERIRVVILDRTMPAIGGEEAFDAMRHIRRETPVILLSGHLENRAAEKFIREDLAGFVKKPFLPTTLLRAVRDALEG